MNAASRLRKNGDSLQFRDWILLIPAKREGEIGWLSPFFRNLLTLQELGVSADVILGCR